MATSEAQINANRQNAARSTGPKTVEGKAQSRCNALKHGMTGAGVVIVNEDIAEVARRLAAFEQEMQVDGEIGRALAYRAAVLSVRMERAAWRETAAVADLIRQAEDDFVVPERVDGPMVDVLRVRACAKAMFDTSKEATLARKYEAAAESGFYRALKELRQLGAKPKALDPMMQAEVFRQELASFMPDTKLDRKFDEMYAAMDREMPFEPLDAAISAQRPASGGRVDVPFTIGRPR